MPLPSVHYPPHPDGRNTLTDPSALVVGVFDSGVGGLSVLPALRRSLPTARLVYVADSGHAPYGEREEAWLVDRCQCIAQFLKERGAHLMVMACNTATAAAAPALRIRFPDWPIVGIEPGIKPAAQHSVRHRIGVMATRATLRSARFERLLAAYGQDTMVVAQACTGLAMAIERGDEQEIDRLVTQHTQAMREAGVDTLVMGCTHYPFARPWIERAMGPGVAIVDTADAVARRAAQLAFQIADPPHTTSGSRANDLATGLSAYEFWTSGNPATLNAFAQRWLGWAIAAESLGC